MTNYERIIKAMSVEEMAEHLPLCDKISLNVCDKYDDCVNCKLAWLNSESEGGEQE